MKESVYIVILAFMLIFALWFVLYVLIRVRRHWYDGKEQIKSKLSVTLLLKYILCVWMFLISIFQILICVKYNEDVEDIRILKIIIFSLSTLDWVLSILMLKIEARLGLLMKWAGHRIFWPMNLTAYVVFFSIEILNHEGKFLEYLYKYDMAIDAVGIAICFVLTVLCVFKPNEFEKQKDEVSENLLKKARFTIGYRLSMPEGLGLAGAVRVSIKDYKIKVENGKQVIFYNINVKIKGDSHKIRRTYRDFDKIYKAIRKSFPLEIFPYMNFPVFPVFSGASLSTEEKTAALNEFLESLCCPEFMIEETIDFLNIKGEFREKLLEEHFEFVENAKAANPIEVEESDSPNRSIVSDHKLSVFEKSSKVRVNLHIYFQVKVQVAEQSNKTEYIVAWTFSNNPEETIVHKKYKDFAGLNSQLKKILSPAILPKFPTKTYVQNLRKTDTNALEIRRRKLEKYLNHILNDPAFQCSEVLDFIDCKLEINEIWRRTSEIEYELIPPIGWEGELNENSVYVIYVLTFSKYVNNIKVTEWTVKRTFSDFEYMDGFLSKRTKSPQISKHPKTKTEKPPEWPKLPSSHPAILEPSLIEKCRAEIESYLEQVCLVSYIGLAYEFKCFIDDLDTNF